MTNITVEQIKNIKICLKGVFTKEEISLLVNKMIEGEVDYALGRIIGYIEKTIQLGELGLRNASDLYEKIGIPMKEVFRLRQIQS